MKVAEKHKNTRYDIHSVLRALKNRQGKKFIFSVSIQLKTSIEITIWQLTKNATKTYCHWFFPWNKRDLQQLTHSVYRIVSTLWHFAIIRIQTLSVVIYWIEKGMIFSETPSSSSDIKLSIKSKWQKNNNYKEYNYSYMYRIVIKHNYNFRSSNWLLKNINGGIGFKCFPMVNNNLSVK